MAKQVFVFSLLFSLFLIGKAQQRADSRATLSAVEVQTPQGFEAQAAPVENFPEIGPTVHAPVSIPEGLPETSPEKASLNAQDVILMSLAGLALGLAFALGGLLLGLIVTIIIQESFIPVLIGVLATYPLGIGLGVTLVGNKPHRKGKFWAAFLMALLAFLVLGAFTALLPPFVLIAWLVPIPVGVWGWWLSSRKIAAAQGGN